MNSEPIIDPKRLIQKFDTALELDKFVAGQLIDELQKPGLILLPAGNTFAKCIYPLVNDYYKEDYNKAKLHSEMKLSHLDELITDDASKLFAPMIKSSLAELASEDISLDERFYSIDINDHDSFDKYIKRFGGPRLIYMGLGVEPELAHVAYIGEEYINSTTAIVKLSEAESAKQNIKEAITIGTDIFKVSNLEAINVIVQGSSKAESLKNAFEDPDTGLGYLIKHHASKLKIMCDHEAIALLKNSSQW